MYDRMDRLLMALGFTKSKADSNLCFKVEGGRPVMLMLYVNDLFLTGKEEPIKDAKRILFFEFEDERLGYDALLSRHGGVAEYGRNIPWIREVCSRNPEEVQDDGLQGHDHTYGIEPEAIE